MVDLAIVCSARGSGCLGWIDGLSRGCDLKWFGPFSLDVPAERHRVKDTCGSTMGMIELALSKIAFRTALGDASILQLSLTVTWNLGRKREVVP